LKGAADGGIDVPHNDRRFVGFDKEQKKLDPAVLRDHIFGSHIGEFMKKLKAEDAEGYTRQFGKYAKANIKPEDIAALWGKVHKAIRANPSSKLTTKHKPTGPAAKKYNKSKLSLSQRKDRVRQKLSNARVQPAAEKQ